MSPLSATCSMPCPPNSTSTTYKSCIRPPKEAHWSKLCLLWPLYTIFYVLHPSFGLFLPPTTSTCCSYLEDCPRATVLALPHTHGDLICRGICTLLLAPVNLWLPVGAVNHVSFGLGMCTGVTNPPVPPSGRAQNHILAWLAPGLILLLWLLHWFPSKEILNMSLAHSLYLRVCSGNPDLLTFEQSGASGKAEFSIRYGQGRENLWHK